MHSAPAVTALRDRLTRSRSLSLPERSGRSRSVGSWASDGTHGSMARWKSFLPFLAMWLFLAAALLMQGLPWSPKTPTHWLLVIGLGPPLYLLGEGIFTWLLSAEHGHRISPRAFSGLRILAALIAVIICFGLAWLVASWLKVE